MLYAPIQAVAAHIATIERNCQKASLTTKQPEMHYYGNNDFRGWARALSNYLHIMDVQKTDHVQFLLTFLDQKSFNLVCRIIPQNELILKAYENAVKLISGIVADESYKTQAVVRLS